MTETATPKKFAIFRVGKIKNLGALTAHSNHVGRTVPTPNADPDMPPPKALIGSGNAAKEARARLATLPKKPRKNATLANEIFLGASPDWLRNGGPPGSFDTTRTALLASVAKSWVIAEFGDNAVSLVMHLDESTPHFHGTLVCVDEDDSPTGKIKGRRLNAAKYFDGPEKLARLQDSWAAATAHLGLERGVRGSPAHHQDVRRLYGSLEADATRSVESTAKMAALNAGMDAYAEGLILSAGKTPQNRGFFVLDETRPVEQRRALVEAVRPAFRELWHWVARQTAQAARRASLEAADAVRAVRERFQEAEATLERARAVSPFLEPAERAQAVHAAAALQRAGRKLPELSAKGGDAR